MLCKHGVRFGLLPLGCGLGLPQCATQKHGGEAILHVFFGWIYEPLTEVALLLSAPVEPSDLDQPSSCSGWIYEPPTEAALLPPAAVEPSDVDDYRVVLSLSLARKLGVESIQQTQQKL